MRSAARGLSDSRELFLGSDSGTTLEYPGSFFERKCRGPVVIMNNETIELRKE